MKKQTTKKLREEVMVECNIRLPKDTVNKFALIAAVSNVTPEQAMQVCVSLSLLRHWAYRKQ